LLNKFETGNWNVYKLEETNSYKIEIGYRLTEIIKKFKEIFWWKKTENSNIKQLKELYFYEDIFYFTDKLKLKRK
jgi:hypothetical protein